MDKKDETMLVSNETLAKKIYIIRWAEGHA